MIWARGRKTDFGRLRERCRRVQTRENRLPVQASHYRRRVGRSNDEAATPHMAPDEALLFEGGVGGGNGRTIQAQARGQFTGGRQALAWLNFPVFDVVRYRLGELPVERHAGAIVEHQITDHRPQQAYQNWMTSNTANSGDRRGLPAQAAGSAIL